MLAEERKRRILEMLNKNGVLKVAELSRALETTEATIRRDLVDLQNQNKLSRVHGGATLQRPISRMAPQSLLGSLNLGEKKLIARAAYSLLQDNDAVIMDVSTTVLELAKLIAAGSLRNLSIITNSFSVVQALISKKEIRLIHTGGQVEGLLNSSLGTVAENMLRNIRADKCFIGTNGIHPEYGYSSPTFEEASIKQVMMRSARKRIVLSDHTKFGETYMGKFADFRDSVDILVTDELPAEFSQHYAETNTKVIVARQGVGMTP